MSTAGPSTAQRGAGESRAEQSEESRGGLHRCPGSAEPGLLAGVEKNNPKSTVVQFTHLVHPRFVDSTRWAPSDSAKDRGHPHPDLTKMYEKCQMPRVCVLRGGTQ